MIAIPAIPQDTLKRKYCRQSDSQLRSLNGQDDFLEYLPLNSLASKVGPCYIGCTKKPLLLVCGWVGGTSILPRKGFFLFYKNEKGAGPQSLFMTFGTAPLQDYNAYQGVLEALSITVPFGTPDPP